MRIAILSDAVLPWHRGGKETLHFERSRRLAARGHDVRVFTMHWWPQRERVIVRDGVTFEAICPLVRMYTRAGRRSIWETVVFGLATVRLLWGWDFDVLDVDQFPFLPSVTAWLVCRLRRKPMTATWYEVWSSRYWREYMGWLGLIGGMLQRIAVRCGELIFADSQLTAERLTAWLSVAPDRVVRLPPAGLESLPRGEPLPKVVDCVFIGRLLPHKHVDVLIEALAELPSVSGLIIGSGPERDRLGSLVARLAVAGRVTFAGALSREDATTRLRGSRLLVLPSTREGFGLSVFEANAYGVPALIIRHPDNAALEMVRDGENGLVCDLDPVAIAARIRSFLDDPVMQARMSHAAIQAASGFSWEAYVTRMLRAIESLRPRVLVPGEAPPGAPAADEEKAA